MTRPTLLVPLDGTQHARVALPVARALAKIEGATLRILHVGDRPRPPSELPLVLGLEPHEVEGAVLESVTGSPAKAILEAARVGNTRLIVLCTHTAPAHPRPRVGRTATEVLRHARCPVMLIPVERGVLPWELQEILVPFDGTPSTAEALQRAGELACLAQATVFVLHVATAEQTSQSPGTLAAPRYVDQPHHEWPAWSRELLERLACLCHLPGGVKSRLFVASGDPGAEIVRFAIEHHVDLIAVAWRGRLGAERAKVIRTILSDAKCPVLVSRIQE